MNAGHKSHDCPYKEGERKKETKPHKKQDDKVKLPVKKVKSKKNEAVVPKSIPSDSDVRSSSSSSESESSDEILPRDVR